MPPVPGVRAWHLRAVPGDCHPSSKPVLQGTRSHPCQFRKGVGILGWMGVWEDREEKCLEEKAGSKPAMNGTEARVALSRPHVGVFRQTLLKHFFSLALLKRPLAGGGADLSQWTHCPKSGQVLNKQEPSWAAPWLLLGAGLKPRTGSGRLPQKERQKATVGWGHSDASLGQFLCCACSDTTSDTLIACTDCSAWKGVIPRVVFHTNSCNSLSPPLLSWQLATYMYLIQK